jgi:hypothetical protein
MYHHLAKTIPQFSKNAERSAKIVVWKLLQKDGTHNFFPIGNLKG